MAEGTGTPGQGECGASTWARLPLSAPGWMWALYLVLLVWLGFFGWDGGLSAVAAVVFAAGFSFQFWTLSAWRGQVRSVRSET